MNCFDDEFTSVVFDDLENEIYMADQYCYEVVNAVMSIIATLKSCGHTPKYCASGDKHCPICENLALVYSDNPELF